jgi:hypothetical protein
MENFCHASKNDFRIPADQALQRARANVEKVAFARLQSYICFHLIISMRCLTLLLLSHYILNDARLFRPANILGSLWEFNKRIPSYRKSKRFWMHWLKKA